MKKDIIIGENSKLAVGEIIKNKIYPNLYNPRNYNYR